MKQGRIETKPDMSVPGHPALWALGDCAAVPNQHDGGLSPPTAQFAVRQALHLAGNLMARSRGDAGRAYYLSQMPFVGRRLRIFLEWTWGMLFPPDITHLRFTRSHEQPPSTGTDGA